MPDQVRHKDKNSPTVQLNEKYGISQLACGCYCFLQFVDGTHFQTMTNDGIRSAWTTAINAAANFISIFQREGYGFAQFSGTWPVSSRWMFSTTPATMPCMERSVEPPMWGVASTFN